MFPKANPLAVDLMEKCLTFSPKRRIDVEEALQHPYLAVSVALHVPKTILSPLLSRSPIMIQAMNRLRLNSTRPSLSLMMVRKERTS